MTSTSLAKIRTSLGLSLRSHLRAFGTSLSSRALGSSPSSRADGNRTRVIGATLAKILFRILTRFWIKVDGTCQNRTQGQGLLRAFGSRRLTNGRIATGEQSYSHGNLTSEAVPCCVVLCCHGNLEIKRYAVLHVSNFSVLKHVQNRTYSELRNTRRAQP